MPRGWPKGKPRSPEHHAKMMAGSRRAASQRRRRLARMVQEDSYMEATPAIWLSALQHVGDSQYLDDGLDEVLVRALHDRVVYAGSCCCHHETPLQELTVATIAAVEKQYQKKKRNYGAAAPVAKGLLKPFRKPVVTPAVVSREGKSLVDVVAEMFE